jgi:putative hydrolase of the HAD superfamily
MGTPRLRALVFDLWGTLLLDDLQRVEPKRVTRQRLVREALIAAGRVYPEGRIAAALEGLGQYYRELQLAGRDVSIDERLNAALDAVEPGLARRLSPRAFKSIEDAVVAPARQEPPVPAPGALEVLEEARRRKLALGLVSNTGLTPGYVLREILAGHGLLEHLEVLTFSDEARLAKPAPEIFHCTLEALRVKPDEAVFIGDTPRLDIAGPRALGMWTVQVGSLPADGTRPHARIDGLPELFPALRKLGLLKR